MSIICFFRAPKVTVLGAHLALQDLKDLLEQDLRDAQDPQVPLVLPAPLPFQDPIDNVSIQLLSIHHLLASSLTCLHYLHNKPGHLKHDFVLTLFPFQLSVFLDLLDPQDPRVLQALVMHLPLLG